MADAEELPLEIPWRDLSGPTLDNLIEEFVTRDGTDYGMQERDLESRKQDVQRQIERGEVWIAFDQTTQSVNLLRRR
jgi:uncharacterized protein YheU (UPF0270 family)